MFTLVVQGILKQKEKAVGAVGVAYGNDIKAGKEVYIIGKRKKFVKTKIIEIVDPQNGIVEEASGGMMIGLKLDEEIVKDIIEADVITDIEPVKNKDGQMLLNVRLKALLLERQNDKIKTLIGHILEEVAMQAMFLSVVKVIEQGEVVDEDGVKKQQQKISMPALNTQDGKQFFPVFTDMGDVMRWENRPSEQTMTTNFEYYANMMNAGGNISGIVINPFSDNLVLDKELIAKMMKKRKEDLKDMRLDEIIRNNQ